jgi:hypothetical protein
MKWYRNEAVWLWIVIIAIIIGGVAYHQHSKNQQALHQATSTSSKCSPDYTPCIPNVDYDLDCKDIQQRVRVIGTDVYHLDADHDGIGCESY